MVGDAYYENVEECEQCTQLYDESYEEYMERVRKNNPYYD